MEIELPVLAAEASSSSAPPPPPWIDLPEDVTANILQRLEVKDILDSAQKVCSTWRKVCKDPVMWRVIDLKNREEWDEYAFLLMCESAVDHSQGQLIDLSITNFEDDDFLIYVADRSSHLRRLTLEDYNVCGAILAKAVKKCPELEELHLIKIGAIEARELRTIGVNCPTLKSFTYNEHWYMFPVDSDDADYYYGDDHALAIGRSFPNLRHLRLFAHHRMENKGLEAILDGCSHLESLDLRQCSGLDLEGSLGKRLFERIKDVRLPSESIRDYDWPPTEDDWSSEESDDTMSPYSGSDYEEDSGDTGSDDEDLEEHDNYNLLEGFG